MREAEALEFAESVYSVIQHLQTELQSKFPQYVAEEVEREMKVQLSQVPEGVNHITLSTTTVNVDKSKNEVTGVVTKFSEHVAAIHQSRERGFPS